MFQGQWREDDFEVKVSYIFMHIKNKIINFEQNRTNIIDANMFVALVVIYVFVWNGKKNVFKDITA